MAHGLFLRIVLTAALAAALAACTPSSGGMTPNTSPPPPPGTGARPAGPADVAYCDQLASLYERYGSAQDQRGEDFSVGVAEAINQCHNGDPDGGIATLSKLLKDQDFTLPPRPK